MLNKNEHIREGYDFEWKCVYARSTLLYSKDLYSWYGHYFNYDWSFYDAGRYGKYGQHLVLDFFSKNTPEER